ncbi:hypothetical protein [Ralstonia pseudosolanacearum]
MKTEAYVDVGKVVTDHIAPVNAIMTISTATLLPALDFLRPHFPYINQVALLVVAAFLVLLSMKFLKIPKEWRGHPSVLLCAGVCAAAFSIGAIASTRHADQGGLAAATFPWVSDLQKTLLDIKNGKSDDPRVELKNIGVEWKAGNLLQASKDGDLRVVELFLKGGMPVTLSGTGNDHSLPYYVVTSNYPNAEEQLKLFKQYGVNLNDQSLAAYHGGILSQEPPNLYAVAKDRGHEDLASYLADLGVKTDGYPAWKKAKEERIKNSKGIQGF